MELIYPLILDGATGTELQKRGFSGGVSAEEWVLTHPEAILEIQRNYTDAGSNVIYASTFGATRTKLADYGFEERASEVNTKMVEFSKEASAGRAYVAGDLGPIGKMMAPLGPMSFDDLYENYLEQARVLEKAGVDLYVAETMMDVPTARAAVLAAKAVSDKPVFCTFTCDENGRLLTGTDISAALIIMQGLGVDAFGLNCSAGPREMLQNLQKLSKYAEIPLIAKPNAGLPRVEEGVVHYDLTPEEFVENVPAMAEAGVMIYGGCCGTDPRFISALKTKLQDVPMTFPTRKIADVLPAASEKNVYLLDPAAEVGEALTCTEDLEDDIMDACDEEGEILTIAIESEEDIDFFKEAQYMIDKPLCIRTDDAALLEKALFYYQGRALYEGSANEAALQKLEKKYGLIY